MTPAYSPTALGRVAGCDNHTTYTAGCAACRTRSNARKRDRTRRLAYGTWQASIMPAADAHHHIHTLTRHHRMSLRQIAAAAGVARGSVDRIAARPDVSANQRTITAICAVQPARPYAGRSVCAVGAARMLQALTAIGYTADHLAVELDEHPQRVREWRRMARPGILADRRDTIRDLFHRLQGTPGPSDDARAYARARRWGPPLVWDDDDHITDPARRARWTPARLSELAVERGIAGEVTAAGLTEHEREQVVRHLVRTGWSDRRIADHLRWAGGGQAGRHAVRRWRYLHRIEAGSSFRARSTSTPTTTAADHGRINEREAA